MPETAQLLSYLHTELTCTVPGHGYISVERAVHLDTGLQVQFHQTLQTDGESRRRYRLLVTQLLHQAIIATAGAYCALRAQIQADPLEYRPIIVVQAAN